MFDLTGKTALVTGANTGLGQGMALALANAGANIALIGRTEPVETLKALTKIDVKSHSITADLENADDMDDIIAEVLSKLGPTMPVLSNAMRPLITRRKTGTL